MPLRARIGRVILTLDRGELSEAPTFESDSASSTLSGKIFGKVASNFACFPTRYRMRGRLEVNRVMDRSRHNVRRAPIFLHRVARPAKILIMSPYCC